ncbi:Ras GTPase [Apophysomyces ossiformis]|uniref:Ras GTPase n=1 Tax=Apophysomyces ossiformis TaxID=679940 RepID=A0A8H7BU76_9FUNG|nr:Ras GTPase [Apophysomyces ossiformis]
MREQYMRNGEGFLLVYSITSRVSFDELRQFHQQIQRVKDRDTFPMVLVANKSDLESERQVSTQEGRDLAKSFSCPWIETSAKQRYNVDEAFHQVVRDIREYNRLQESREAERQKIIMEQDAALKKKESCSNSRFCCTVM